MSEQPTVEATIEALLHENRVFRPSAQFAASANTKADIREKAQNWQQFWEDEARRLDWFQPWDKVLEWNVPYAKWFIGGKLNVSYNCMDRHVAAGRGDKVAYYWEGEPEGERRTITFSQLKDEVCRFANALKALGVHKGDRVAIYMGMVPELPIAMLACARIGAPHSVVFGGFSAEALRDRINDGECKVLITQDGGFRRGNIVPLKANCDEALTDTPSIEHVVVLKRTGRDVPMQAGRDVWWHDAVQGQSTDCPPEHMDSEDILYLLYSSGTTAKPKGIVHTTGGYLTGVASTHYRVFDIQPETIYWCAADIGWVTGHSYIVYGPLANCTTGVIYEGTPDYPDKDRLWAIVERYKVNVLYTAPTAIRTFMKWGPEYPQRHDMSSLRVLGSVGEPINPEAWVWYSHYIGGDRCPVVDTWWQTETGHILITPLPGITATKPGSATFPYPGIAADVVDEKGNSVPLGGGGYLVLTRPWPGMLRGLWRDPERYQQTYWSRYPGVYFTGDGAKRDDEGYFWLLGRVDDVVNVSGHRISTIEVESALVDHPAIAEAAVAARSDPITGQAIVVYVTPKVGVATSRQFAEELRDHVGRKIGAIAKPRSIVFTEELPKTRSGKIMRRLLRDIAEQRQLGDTTTLADASVVEELKARAQTEEDEG